jgi:hypothetical protein
MGKRGLFRRGLGALAAGLALLSPLAACGPRMGGPAPLVMGASPWPGSSASGTPETQLAQIGVRPGERVATRSPLVAAALPPRAEEAERPPRRPEKALRNEPAAAPRTLPRLPASKPALRPPVHVAAAVPSKPPHQAPATR